MSDKHLFRAIYDAAADVLYLSVRKEAAAKGVEDKYGIVWRYDGSGRLIGATVMDFHEVWSDKSDELAGELSRHFHIPEPQMQVIVDRALEQKDN